MRKLIGIDIGGSFTDLCCWDGSSQRVAKTATTPDDLIRGVRHGLDLLDIRDKPPTAADPATRWRLPNWADADERSHPHSTTWSKLRTRPA